MEIDAFEFLYYLQMGLSYYDILCVVNYVRKRMKDNAEVMEVIREVEDGDAWRKEEYLLPVVENDPIISYEWDDDYDDDGSGTGDDWRDFIDSDAGLKEQLNGLDLSDPAVREVLSGTNKKDDIMIPANSNLQQKTTESIDGSYFDSYGFMDIHREMLEDQTRTESYRIALEENPSLMNGAHVLDVGCGTGVLSIFAARGGASNVIAVDGSPNIASVARAICSHNGWGDRIQVVSSKLEEIESLPTDSVDGKVDVLVSEWMGMVVHAVLHQDFMGK